MTFTLQELTDMSGGELAGGDPAQVVTGAAALAEATAGEITFFGDSRYLAAFRRSRASAAFVPAEFTEQIVPAQIRVVQPAKAFEQVVLRLAPRPIEFAPGIHATAVIAGDVQLGDGVSVQAHAVIERGARIGAGTVIGAQSYIGHECVLGADCRLHPRVTIRERTRIGDRVTIHSGAVIGADGFGFELVEGRYEKVPQIGIVQLDDDVEIGANTTIDCARFGRTWIQEGVKIDNLVQVAHNVVIGRHSVIAAQTGIAGSSRVGEYVMMGGQVGVTGHVEIGDRTALGAKSGVSKNLPAGSGTWWGVPATRLADAKEQLAWLHRLGKLFARVKALEEKLRE